jgi:hypothetical protein
MIQRIEHMFKKSFPFLEIDISTIVAFSEWFKAFIMQVIGNGDKLN